MPYCIVDGKTGLGKPNVAYLEKRDPVHASRQV